MEQIERLHVEAVERLGDDLLVRATIARDGRKG